MVKLFCAIVGDAGNAFPVDVDNSASVGDLKKVIKAENPATITCDAKDLRLFLAKKDGAWLTEADVKKGVEDTNGLKLLDAARARLQRVGLSDQDVGGVDEEAEAEGRGPVNVLVDVPSNPILEKMKKQKKDGGSTSQNSFLDGLITDFFSLLWPLDEIHSTKKDV